MPLHAIIMTRFRQIWNPGCYSSLTIDQGNTLDEQIVADEHRQKIEKEIAKLEKQARTEKQPKKKFELVQRVKALKKLIKELNGSEE